MSERIHRHNIPTSGGNTLSIFYNPDSNLFVVDLVETGDERGNEIVRMTLNEIALLDFPAPPIKRIPFKKRVKRGG